MPEPVACPRHPDTETRLRCSACGTPICPRDAVQTPVGQKCPDCAKQPRSARAAGKPRQYVRGGLYGLGASAVLGFAFRLYLGSGLGFLTLIISFFLGMGIGHAVRTGAEGNAQPPFRNIAVGLAVVTMLAVWGSFGVLFPGGLRILTYPAIAYGAYTRFQ